jgi:hypothetical protein
VIPQGVRNVTLFTFACSRRAYGADFDAICMALREANRRCQPEGLDESTLVGIARSACRYPAGRALDRRKLAHELDAIGDYWTANAASWNYRTRTGDLAIVEALRVVALRCGSRIFDISFRELAELAGCNWKTLARSLSGRWRPGETRTAKPGAWDRLEIAGVVKTLQAASGRNRKGRRVELLFPEAAQLGLSQTSPYATSIGATHLQPPTAGNCMGRFAPVAKGSATLVARLRAGLLGGTAGWRGAGGISKSGLRLILHLAANGRVTTGALNALHFNAHVRRRAAAFIIEVEPRLWQLREAISLEGLAAADAVATAFGSLDPRSRQRRQHARDRHYRDGFLAARNKIAPESDTPAYQSGYEAGRRSRRSRTTQPALQSDALARFEPCCRLPVDDADCPWPADGVTSEPNSGEHQTDQNEVPRRIAAAWRPRRRA